MNHALLLAVLLWAPAVPELEPPDPTDRLRPDTVFRTARGVRVVLLRTPGAGTAALRLHAHMPGDGATPGAGHLLRILAEEDAASRAERLGLRAGVSREGAGLVYRVAGARHELDALFDLLNRAAGEPAPSDPSLRAALDRLEEMRAARAETPGRRLRSGLRDVLGEAQPAPRGAPALAPDDARSLLRRAWRRSHAPERLTLVAVGDLEPAVLSAGLEASAEEAAPDPGPPDAPPVRSPEGASDPAPQTLRVWRGRAVRLGRGQLPETLVAARLAARHLEERSAPAGLRTSVEVWRAPEGPVLAVVGAAYPEDEPELVALLDGIVDLPVREETLRSLSGAAAADLLLEARTPAGLADVVGREIFAGGGARAAAFLVRELVAVERVAVAQILAALEAEGVATEVRP